MDMLISLKTHPLVHYITDLLCKHSCTYIFLKCYGHVHLIGHAYLFSNQIIVLPLTCLVLSGCQHAVRKNGIVTIF